MSDPVEEVIVANAILRALAKRSKELGAPIEDKLATIDFLAAANPKVAEQVREQAEMVLDALEAHRKGQTKPP